MKITVEFDPDRVGSATNTELVLYWHLAQANPARHGDHDAGDAVEKVGREIIRRWLRGQEPEPWHHQGRDYYWSALTRFAKYEPGGPPESPEFHHGRWVPRTEPSEGEAP